VLFRSHDDFFLNLTQLVVDTFEKNNNSKVVFIAHSMGNPMLLYWLNNYVTQSFKDKYIRAHISIAGVWGGAAKTLRLMASGDNIDISVVRPIAVRPYQRSAPSTAWLMPSHSFWAYDEVLVSRPSQNYTVHDYLKFFNDLNHMDGYHMRVDTQNLVHDLSPPNIEYHALFSTGLKTPESFIYTESQWPDGQPSVIYGDGDGTVNLRSLLGFKRWIDNQKQGVFFKEFKNIDHLAILKNQGVVDYILDYLSS